MEAASACNFISSLNFPFSAGRFRPFEEGAACQSFGYRRYENSFLMLLANLADDNNRFITAHHLFVVRGLQDQ